MKSFLQIGVVLFLLVNALSFFFKGTLAGGNIAVAPLLYGNAWLFGITFLSFYFELKGIRQPNAHAFFRHVYTGMLLKLFGSIAVVLVYILTDREAITRGVVLAWLLLYIVYTGVEMSRLLEANKEKK